MFVKEARLMTKRVTGDSPLKIGSFPFNQGRTFIIAEIGGNHEGDFERAQTMVKAAAEAGADAVKFQVFKAERIIFAGSGKPAYSGVTHQAQWERFKKLEFTRRQYEKLKQLADACGVIFLASVFDQESAESIDDLLPAYKVASGDLTYYQLLRFLAKRNKPILLSTGASTFPEIRKTVAWVGRKHLILLHCVCSYPAPHEEMNLNAIPYLRDKLKVPIGFSDHSVGNECAIAAAALGACVIEKHFTLDKSVPYGDHKLSLTPSEFRQMVSGIRIIEKALGSYGRPLLECERRARSLVRRSLFATRDLVAGHTVTERDVTALRPLEGIPAENAPRLFKKKIKRAVGSGAPLEPTHF